MDFETVFRLYFKDVFYFVRSLAADEATAEEVTQETFFKALKAIDSFDGKNDIRAWLFTIARNTYYSQLRQQKTSPMNQFVVKQDWNRKILRCSLLMKNAPFSFIGTCMI